MAKRSQRNPWQTFFAPESAHKGQTYANEQRVGAISGDDTMLLATVRGTKRNRCIVNMDDPTIDAVLGLCARNIESECECPVLWNCKHAAAILQTWATRHGSSSTGLSATVNSAHASNARVVMAHADASPPQLAWAKPRKSRGADAIQADRWVEAFSSQAARSVPAPASAKTLDTAGEPCLAYIIRKNSTGT